MYVRLCLLTVWVVGMAASTAEASPSALDVLREHSDAIAVCKVLSVEGGAREEVGVTEWSARARVLRPAKGTLTPGSDLYVRFQRLDFRKTASAAALPEPPSLTVGTQYVLFLRGRSGQVRGLPAYELADRWLGAQPYTPSSAGDIAFVSTRTDGPAAPADQKAARGNLWKAFRKACPEKYREIEVYAENLSLTNICFRSHGLTLLFTTRTGKVDVVQHMKVLPPGINRITFEKGEKLSYFVLWRDGQAELEIGADD